MTKITIAKEETKTEPQYETQDTPDNKLELLKYTTQVQSRIKTDITSDFTLSKLQEKDKEFIIEHTTTAYYCKRILTKIRNTHKYEWNNKEKYWTKRNLTIKETQKLIKGEKENFDGFMDRIYLINILNRNVDKNHLINILAGQQTNQEQAEIPTRIKNKVTENKEQTETEQ